MSRENITTSQMSPREALNKAIGIAVEEVIELFPLQGKKIKRPSELMCASVLDIILAREALKKSFEKSAILKSNHSEGHPPVFYLLLQGIDKTWYTVNPSTEKDKDNIISLKKLQDVIDILEEKEGKKFSTAENIEGILNTFEKHPSFILINEDETI